jgi:hypothetical protein
MLGLSNERQRSAGWGSGTPRHRKAPFHEIFDEFVFVTYKIIFSKYMLNLVSSKCIYVLRLPISSLFVP